MIRLRAASIHLGICLIIALIFSALVFGVWYPPPLDRATNVFTIFWIILAVDVTLGPLITFIIYNPKKKELKWDLCIVALIQLSALFYGVYTVYLSRPAYLVFNVDRFDLVQAKELTPEKFEQVSNEQFKRNPIFGYRIIAAKLPDDPEERSELMFSALNGGDDLPFLPKYYVEYKSELKTVKSHIASISDLHSFNPSQKNKIKNLEKKYMGVEVGFLAVKAPYENLTAIMDKKTGEVLKIVALQPWESSTNLQ
ncbi:MAG: TfpX/TfpZ family type IV pilin accessory protein [Pseudomonadota bacterium]